MDPIREGNIVDEVELVRSINELKLSRNAVILAHYYQDPEIQDIADFVGDSLELSRYAKKTNSDVIVFCGVKFMAESAKILNPEKLVLLPDINAGCSLESSCQPDAFYAFKQKYPDHVAVTYINCSAKVKSLSDIIVTSSNAEAIINSIPLDRPILFAPDKHLGNYLMRKTGRTNMILWPGSCVVHENFSEKELIRLKLLHPEAEIIAHPECPENILSYANHIGSTSSLLNYSSKSASQSFIVLTEPGIIHQMKKLSPDKHFHEVSSMNSAGCSFCSDCPYMKMNTLEKIYLALKNNTPSIEIDEPTLAKARMALDRMLDGVYL
jgi:quinolinate synthase